MFKSIEFFSGRDPYPGIPLEEISPYSKRAYSLMIRNRAKPILQEGFINIAGAIEMMGGMDYHHDNIVRLSDLLAEGMDTNVLDLCHEAVAYLNRMGQFYYFAKSTFVTRILQESTSTIPTIEKIIHFRMKHAAHRSIDSPRNETEDAKLSQAMSLMATWGRTMTLKPGGVELIWPRSMKSGSPEERARWRHEWANRYITFQILNSDSNKHENFIVQVEHPKISAESYALLACLMS